MTYSGIHIIYNPNSTGDSKEKADELAKQLRKSLPRVPVNQIATEYAGHAEKIATQIAKKEASPLIVSSSGDGGYNEVVNGVVSAQNPHALCAVLPAGNANDHSRTMQETPLADAITSAKAQQIDLIKISIRHKGEQKSRYAHSYIGLGLTPVVAVELNRHSLNSFKEVYIVLKTFFKYRPFKITHNKKLYRLDSLLFANINQMAKVLTIAPKNRPADGKFEVVMFPSGRKWWLVKRLAKAAVSKLDNVERASRYSFVVIKKMPVQLDGEVEMLQPGSTVTVTCMPKYLRTIT